MRSLSAFGIPLIVFANASAVHGQQAEAIAVVANGQVSGVTMLSGGGGYVAPPGVTLVGGGGWGATAEATLSNGAVAQVLVRNPGSNYSAAPAVIVTPPVDFADGLIHWWRGEFNAVDEVEAQNGTFFGRYASGEVGQCFSISYGGVAVGTNEVLDAANGWGKFTIEAWALVRPEVNPRFPFIVLVSKAYLPTNGWALWTKVTGPGLQLARIFHKFFAYSPLA